MDIIVIKKKKTFFSFLFPFSPYFQTYTWELISFLSFLISLILFISFLFSSLICNQAKHQYRMHTRDLVGWIIYLFKINWHMALCGCPISNFKKMFVSRTSLFHRSLNNKDYFDAIPKGLELNWHIWNIKSYFDT